MNIRHVDFFSLDVEGAELFILQSIDWTRIDVDIFVIEVQERREEIYEFMTSQGYRRLRDRPTNFDDAYVKTGTFLEFS